MFVDSLLPPPKVTFKKRLRKSAAKSLVASSFFIEVYIHEIFCFLVAKTRGLAIRVHNMYYCIGNFGMFFFCLKS